MFILPRVSGSLHSAHVLQLRRHLCLLTRFEPSMSNGEAFRCELLLFFPQLIKRSCVHSLGDRVLCMEISCATQACA